jgi:hypothetical protein
MTSDACAAMHPVPYRLPHRIYLMARGVDTHNALNCDMDAPDMPNTEIAELLNAEIHRLKAEAFDIDQGKVDYHTIRNDDFYTRFRRATHCLPNLHLDMLTTREEKLAFWINLYNTLIVDAVIRYDINKSVQEVSGFFARSAYVIDGYRFSADDIEHGILRSNAGHPAIPGPQFAAHDPRTRFVLSELDPRIHFALVCASESCPLINVYDAESIDQQLTLAAQNFVNGGEFEIDLVTRQVHMSKIFQWYAPDFGGSWLNVLGLGDFSAILQYAGQFLTGSPEKETLLADPKSFKVRLRPYDWTLNLM